jgi:hypothetical protein
LAGVPIPGEEELSHDITQVGAKQGVQKKGQRLGVSGWQASLFRSKEELFHDIIQVGANRGVETRDRC